jgi:hypothetical protein
MKTPISGDPAAIIPPAKPDAAQVSTARSLPGRMMVKIDNRGWVKPDVELTARTAA